MRQAQEKFLHEKNVTFHAKKFAKHAWVSNKSFFHFLKNAVSVVLLVISERVVNAAYAGKIFAGKERNISCQKSCKARLSMKQISMQLLI